MMNNKRFVLALLFIIVLVSFQSAGMINEGITINVAIFCDDIWDNPGVYNVHLTRRIIDQFEKENPGINVECNVGLNVDDYSEWLSQKIINGDAPDILTILPDDFNTFSEIEILMNLDHLIANDDQFDKNLFYRNVLNSGIYNNSYYALPREVDPMLMFVNETLLKKEGIDVPDNEWTWDDLAKICEKVTKDTDGDGIIDQFGVMDFTWEVAADTNGCNLFDEYGNVAHFDSPGMVQSVEFVSKLNTISKGTHPKEEDFNIGQVAFRPFQLSWYRTFKASPYWVLKYNDFNWKCIKLPRGYKGNNAGELKCYLMGINSYTKYPEECWDFLKFLTTNRAAQLDILNNSKGVSVLQSVNKENIEEIFLSIQDSTGALIDEEFLEEVVQTSIIKPRFFMYSYSMEYADRELYRVINEGEDIEDALKKLNKEINTILQENSR